MMTGRTDEAALEAASRAAWRERYVLEVVLFKLETEEALAATERTRWLLHADLEVQLILERARLEELSSAAQWAGVVEWVGQEEPWATIFADHRVAVRQLVGEVGLLAARPTVASGGGDGRRRVREWAERRIVDSETIDLDGWRDLQVE